VISKDAVTETTSSGADVPKETIVAAIAKGESLKCPAVETAPLTNNSPENKSKNNPTKTYKAAINSFPIILVLSVLSLLQD